MMFFSYRPCGQHFKKRDPSQKNFIILIFSDARTEARDMHFQCRFYILHTVLNCPLPELRLIEQYHGDVRKVIVLLQLPEVIKITSHADWVVVMEC